MTFEMVPRLSWSDDEIKLLLSIINENNILKLFHEKQHKREDVLKLVENAFHGRGFTGKNIAHIDNKWKNLKKAYKKAKKTNAGYTCPYYAQLEEILSEEQTDILWNDNETKLLLSVILENDNLELFKNKNYYKREDALKMLEYELHNCGITSKNTLSINTKLKDLIIMYKNTIEANIAIKSSGGIPIKLEIDVKSPSEAVQQIKIIESKPHKCGEIIYIDGQLKYCCFICQNIEENSQTFKEHFYFNHLKDLDDCGSIKSNNDNSDFDNTATDCLLEKPIETFAFEEIEIKEEFKDCPELITNQNDECEIVDTAGTTNLVINDCQREVFKCDFCRLNFSTNNRMIYHKILFKDRKFNCDKCNASICGRRRYKLHNVKYHSIKNIKKIRPSRSYMCYICKIQFKSTDLTSLRVHMRLHTGVRPYKCTECDKAFPVKSSLKMHIHHHHTFERKFMCSECGLRFAFQRTLNAHIKRHRLKDEEPLPCPICSKLLKNSVRLKDHVKIHTNERNFACNECDKTFKTKQVFKQHIQIHSDTRLFPCSFCDLSFSQSAGRRGHIRRVHEGIN